MTPSTSPPKCRRCLTLTSVTMSTADLFRLFPTPFGLDGTESSKKMASRLRFTESRTAGLPVSPTAGDEDMIMILGVIIPAGVLNSKHVLRSGGSGQHRVIACKWSDVTEGRTRQDQDGRPGYEQDADGGRSNLRHRVLLRRGRLGRDNGVVGQGQPGRG